ETIPFAETMARQELKRDWRVWWEEGSKGLQRLLALPGRVEDFLERAERGQVPVQTALAPESKRALQRLERATYRLAWMVVAAALLIAATMLHVNAPQDPWDTWL